MIAAYIVAFSAMVFAAVSALTLIAAVNHFDALRRPDTSPRDKAAA